MSHLTKPTSPMLALTFFVFVTALASFSVSSPRISAEALTQGVVVKTPAEKAYPLFVPDDNTVSMASEALTFDLSETDQDNDALCTLRTDKSFFTFLKSLSKYVPFCFSIYLAHP